MGLGAEMGVDRGSSLLTHHFSPFPCWSQAWPSFPASTPQPAPALSQEAEFPHPGIFRTLGRPLLALLCSLGLELIVDKSFLPPGESH